MKIALKAMVAAFDQFIRYAAHQVFQPLSVFLLSIYRLALANALFVLPGDGVVAIGFVKCFLVVVKDVFLAGTDLRICFGTAFWSVSHEKLTYEPATSEWAGESASDRSRIHLTWPL